MLRILELPESARDHYIGMHGPDQVVLAWSQGEEALYASRKQVVVSKDGILAVSTPKGWRLLGFTDSEGLCGVWSRAKRQPHVSALSRWACFFARGRHIMLARLTDEQIEAGEKVLHDAYRKCREEICGNEPVRHLRLIRAA